MVRNEPRLPIGVIVRVKKRNLQKPYVGCQAKAKIIAFTMHNYKPAYVVRFLNPKYNDLNDQGPFLTEDCIIWTRTLEVLYGKKA